MSEIEKTTLDAILSAAKKEFAEKGFKSASLRHIVKTAGVTTGAFYGYYKSKEELFDALVNEQYTVFMDMFNNTQESFAALLPNEQRDTMGAVSSVKMQEMMKYAHEHKEVFKLLLTCSEGTKYENMIHNMVETEAKATRTFAKAMESLGQPKYSLDPTLEHILISGMFSAFFEVIIHDIPYENTKKYLNELAEFNIAGWKKIMGF